MRTFRIPVMFTRIKPAKAKKPTRAKRACRTKCEGCGRLVHGRAPMGWLGTGESKYGKEYRATGAAYWCPSCRSNANLSGEVRT